MKKQVHIFFTALMFYTRIPCPKNIDHNPEYLNKASRYFPLIGWIVGAIAFGVYAAALMGAGGFTIFRKITLPQMKWGLIYGIILCTARALGEFGAVNALSKTRGQTFTLPLEIDALYMSGTDTSITSAFAVSSILVIIAVIVLILRNIFEYRSKNSKGIQ
jgi:ABC-type polysaccharide transport system permease subunit